VSFDGDEQEYLKYTKVARDPARGSSRDAHSPVLVGLADESGYPHQGVMVFVDNALDPTTAPSAVAHCSTTMIGSSPGALCPHKTDG